MTALRSDVPRLTAEVAKGLDRVDVLQPGHGFVNLTAGVSTSTGAFANVEAGWKPHQALSVFGFGRWTPVESMAGVGARLTF